MRDALILKDKSIYISGAKTDLNIHIRVSKPITLVHTFYEDRAGPFLGIWCILCPLL